MMSRKRGRTCTWRSSVPHFNGAATMMSRKSTRSPWVPPMLGKLQWGRDDDVAEETARRWGNPATKILQWGRDDDVAEEGRGPGWTGRGPGTSMGPRR